MPRLDYINEANRKENFFESYLTSPIQKKRHNHDTPNGSVNYYSPSSYFRSNTNTSKCVSNAKKILRARYAYSIQFLVNLKKKLFICDLQFLG